MAEAVGVEEEVIELTGTQKSAILMMLLGEDEAAEVLKNLSPREVQHLGTAMYSVATADQETVNSVLDEFLEIIKKQTSLGLGAGNYIRNVLQKALGDDKAQSVLSRITPASSERPIEILDWMDARSIAELVQDEHPQIVALIVSYLDFGLASDVLGLLDTQMQSEVIIRIATLEMVDPAALKELEKVMQSKFKANTSLRSSQVGGVKAAAKIMNFTKETMEKRILNDVKKADKDLMQALIRTIEGNIRSFVATKKQAEVLGLRREIVQYVKVEVDYSLEEWGYHLMDLQINDITFDKLILDSMSKVVASNNLKAAAENEGQALLITKTKAAEADGNAIKISAEAEREAARLRGQGVALFRKEVALGMTEAAEQLKLANLDTNVILFSMWTEAIKNFAEYGKGNVIFLDGSAEGMERTMKQIQALMVKPAGTIEKG